MFVRTILTIVAMAALILSGFLLMSWSERANAFTGGTRAYDATPTAPPLDPSRTPTATPVDSAYIPVVIDIVSTPTVWLSPTAPPPPGTDTPMTPTKRITATVPSP